MGSHWGLLQSQEEAIYVNTAVKEKKKTPDTQLVALSFGKEQQWPYRPYVYGNTNHSI